MKITIGNTEVSVYPGDIVYSPNSNLASFVDMIVGEDKILQLLPMFIFTCDDLVCEYDSSFRIIRLNK